MMKLYENIKKLVQYGINTGLTPECERIYTTNLLLDLFQENDYEDSTCDTCNSWTKHAAAGSLRTAWYTGIFLTQS